MPTPTPDSDRATTPEFDRLIQRLRQPLDRRGLGRLTAGALGAAGAWSLLDDADAKKKKKKKSSKKKNKATTTAAPTPTTAAPTPATTTTPTPAAPFSYDESLGEHVLFLPGVLHTPESVDTDGSGNVYVADARRCQILKFSPTGTFIEAFGEEGDGPGQFLYPSALALDSGGRMFVSDESYAGEDFAGYIVKVLNANGSPGGTLDGSPVEMSDIMGIAVRSSDDHIFVAVSVNSDTEPSYNTLLEWDDTLAYVQDWPNLNINCQPAFDTAGRLYGGVSNVGGVVVYDSTNNFSEITAFGSFNYPPGDGEFTGFDGIAVDNAGSVFVLDGATARVQQFTWNGPETALTYTAQFGSVGGGANNLNGPRDLAAGNGGKLYIADTGNHRIQQLSSALAAEDQWQAKKGEFFEPSAVTRDNSGNYYVVDGEGHAIHKLNSAGVAQERWGGYGFGNGQFVYPSDVVMSPGGNLYVVDNNSRVQVLDTSGGYVTQLTDYLGYPTAAVFDSAGNLYVLAQDTDDSKWRVVKFDSSNTYVTRWDGSGSGGIAFTYVNDLAIHGDRLYVSAEDYFNSVYRIHVFDLDGAPQGIIPLEAGVGQLALDTAGRLFTAAYDGPLSIRNASGAILVSFGAPGEDEGEISSVQNLGFDTNGSLLVVDGNSGVMRFTEGAGRANHQSGKQGGKGRKDKVKPKGKGKERKQGHGKGRGPGGHGRNRHERGRDRQRGHRD